MESVVLIVLIAAIQICYLQNYIGLLSTSLVTAIVVLAFTLKPKDDGNYPPGPKGLPIVGCLPWLILKSPDEYSLQLAKQYGEMCSLSIGPARIISINDYETIKEISQHPEIQGRVQNELLTELFGGCGIVLAEGPRWKHQRRFVLHCLRDFGMGKMRIQEKLIEEFQHVVEEMRKSDGEPYSMDMILQKATCNIIFSMSLDKRFDYDDPDYIRRLERLNLHFKLLDKSNLVTLSPKLQFLVANTIKKLKANCHELLSQADDFIAEHEEVLDEDNPRDLIDFFLIEMRKKSTKEDDEYLSTFTKKQLQVVLFDLFFAGTETTSTTIRWAILYMLHYPDIQEKVQAEIDGFVGRDRPPSMEDRLNLPFTAATLQEIERAATIVPAGIVRSNPKTVEFKGYKFPPRCLFTLNIRAVHMDEKLWKNPEEFNPARFIDSDGKVFRPPYLIPFGSGKRNCVGESLARMEIFLLFATLMQNFKFAKAGDKLPSMKAALKGVRSPGSFSVCAQARF